MGVEVILHQSNLAASVSSPIVQDQLFLRLSGAYASRDGYLKNEFLDTDVDKQSGGTGRAQLLWTPSNEWEISLKVDFERY